MPHPPGGSQSMELMTVGGHGGHGGQDQELYRSSQAFMTVTEDHRAYSTVGQRPL